MQGLQEREVREFNQWTDCKRYAVTVDLSIYPCNLTHPTLPTMGLPARIARPKASVLYRSLFRLPGGERFSGLVRMADGARKGD